MVMSSPFIPCVLLKVHKCIVLLVQPILMLHHFIIKQLMNLAQGSLQLRGRVMVSLKQ